jgi:hypothetical protein
MNAKTFVSNAEGAVEHIEITELETSGGRTVRIMFDSHRDDIRIYKGVEGRIWVAFYKDGGREIVEPVGRHVIPYVRKEDQ